MRIPVILLILSILEYSVCNAQKYSPACQEADKLMQEYMQLSRLGPGYSRDITREVTDQFKALFEKDAFLFWDLSGSASDSMIHPLTVDEYISRAERTYDQKQPLLDYTGVKIRVQQEGKCAVVFCKKTNQVLGIDGRPGYKNLMKLRINVNLNRETPLIQNIAEDKRVPFIRTISVGINYWAWSNVLSAITQNPVVEFGANEQYDKVRFTSGISVQGGVLAEMNVNRNIRNGITFSAGIFYSQLPVSSSMTNYSNTFPDTRYKTTAGPLAHTTSESSPEVTEQIEISKVEIPLFFKTRLGPSVYFKAGTAPGYVTGTSDVRYVLNQSGDGQFTDLKAHNQTPVDKDHQPGQRFYGNNLYKSYHFPKENFIKKVTLSIQVAAGFEKQFNYFSFGVEPNFSFGTNPVSKRTMPGNYRLDNIASFNSILESVKTPAFEFAFGVRFLVSYVFKN